MEADFSGYATKAGLKCSDGRTIMPDAFKDNHGMKVPLVWQHGHNDPTNVLGHAVLENRPDGVYAYGYFNDTDSGQSAKTLVEHKDITMLSIYANKLVERGKNVLHGAIREVSLVLSGANPGALIDNVRIAHSDGDVETLDDEAVIYTGLTLEHESPVVQETVVDTPEKEKTVQDVYDELTEEQKTAVNYMIGLALEEGAKHEDSDDEIYQSDEDDESDDESDDDSDESDDEANDETPNDAVHNEDNQEGTEMTHNVFEKDGAGAPARPTLTHDQLKTIFEDAQRHGSFKEAFLQHATTYGIENIDLLFPDAQTLANSPELVSRRMEWVSTVLAETKHSPFSRIKSLSADITLDDARAKGYVKGSLKKDEFFALSRRVTTPTTIYKKQKLDRDDIIDVTDLDVVAWLKAEMRVMLDEEIARAILIGDGREADDDDKINEHNIRPIAKDDNFYAHQVVVAANVTGDNFVEAIVRARVNYKGSGNPTLFCSEAILTDLLLVKDKLGRRIYATEQELASALRCEKIVPVPVLDGETTNGGELLAILVNLSDYTIGADKGGVLSMFDDFDIDYNQYKYLIESRLSGCLTKHKTALVISRAAGTLVAPTAPTFVEGTGVVTIPSKTGVVYFIDGVEASSGAQAAIDEGTSVEVTAEPDTDYYFAANTVSTWTFSRPLGG